MYTDMATILEVKRLYDEGMKKVRISEHLQLSRPTIDKILKLEDFSSIGQNDMPPKAENDGAESKRPSILDPFKDTIKSWLEADKAESRKQRHTNERIFERLVEECGYTGSSTTVYNYVRQLREEMSVYKKKNAAEGYLPLYHYAGEAQVDFGKARFEENGRSHNGSYLILSFPYSNYGLVQLTYGENLECVLEPLKAIFEHLGKVPKEIWFDNASSIVKIINHERDVSQRFERFARQYKFNYKFMSPGKGNQKGNVERKVATIRNAFLVPVPKFKNLAEKNKEFLEKCTECSLKEVHYKKGVLISELFKEDLEASHDLPSMPFDTSHKFTVHTDKCGIFTLANGNHSYSSAPNYCEKDLEVVLTSGEVKVYEPGGELLIVTHPRMYGSANEKMERIDYIPYLKFIARKPHSFHNMPIKELMPPRLCSYIEGLPNTERGIVLTELWELTQQKGLAEAIEVLAMRYTPEPVPNTTQPGGGETAVPDEDLTDSVDFGLGAYADIF